MAYIDDVLTQQSNLSFFKKLMKASLLSREEEKSLVEQWRKHQDKTALHTLITAYQRLVISISIRFVQYELPLSDLVQEGNIGLLQAALRFDTERNLRFATYASWWIRSSIQNFILRNWSIVRTGTTTTQKMLFFNLRHLKGRIAGQALQPLSDEWQEQLAVELGVPVTEIDMMDKRITQHDQSLNTIETEGRGEKVNLLPDSRPTPEEECINHHLSTQQHDLIEAGLALLSEKERAVIQVRQLSDESISLRKAADMLKISKERVRQLELSALRKMRVAFLKKGRMGHDFYKN